MKRFEDMDAWKTARELNKDIYAITKVAPSCHDFSFVDQIRRASTSVMNNLAEGFERGTNKDFAKFVFIARGSVGEVRSMLYIALDQKYIAQDQFEMLHDRCVKCSQICWGLIKHLQKNSGWRTGFAISLWMLISTVISPR